MRIRLNLKIFIFILIFLLTRQIKIYGILMIFAFIHEIGHMVCGILLGFKPDLLEIMPFGLSIGFEGKVDNYNKKIGKTSILTLKKMIIAFAGPLTNITIAAIFMMLPVNIFNILQEEIIYANILIGIFNLIPIYPLDGGRILKDIVSIFIGNRKSYSLINKISYIVVVIFTAIGSILILYIKNLSILFVLAYLWYLVIRENKVFNNKRKLYERLLNLSE